MSFTETDLFEPVKGYLEGQGYAVYAEVKQCDMTARRGEELIIVELKKSVTVKLLCQAVRRQELTESVYLAVAVAQGKRVIPSYKEIRRLLRRLGLGLIFVRFMKTKTRVEVVLHPHEHLPRKRLKGRASVIKEMDGRYAEFNAGGSPVTKEKITAYKQSALLIASLLAEQESASPAGLRAQGTGPKTQTILAANHYGWFKRVSRGLYALSDAGPEVLTRYAGEIRKIRREHSKRMKAPVKDTQT